MNPYQHLLDGPDRLDATEHTAECLAGMGVPWGQEPPRIPVPDDATEKALQALQARRAARKAAA